LDCLILDFDVGGWEAEGKELLDDRSFWSGKDNMIPTPMLFEDPSTFRIHPSGE